jgi:hypothetical protein
MLIALSLSPSLYMTLSNNHYHASHLLHSLISSHDDDDLSISSTHLFTGFGEEVVNEGSSGQTGKS